MKRFWTLLIALGCAAVDAYQTVDPQSRFEVASVKTFDPSALARAGGGRKGGGGPPASDPGRIHYAAIRLMELIENAYAMSDYQITGPNWLGGDEPRFVVDATMPPATPKEQLRVMLQNLLADRFKLTAHRTTRDLPVYALVVAKGGPKLNESAPAPAADHLPTHPGGGRGRGEDQYGFPNWRMGPEGGTWRFFINGRARVGGERATMAQLADELRTTVLRSPVSDETGLRGKYDFLLTFAMQGINSSTAEASDPLPYVFGAVQELGLRLEQKKGPVEVLVIDHIERTPTEN